MESEEGYGAVFFLELCEDGSYGRRAIFASEYCLCKKSLEQAIPLFFGESCFLWRAVFFYLYKFPLFFCGELSAVFEQAIDNLFSGDVYSCSRTELNNRFGSDFHPHRAPKSFLRGLVTQFLDFDNYLQ